jgi:hypothetical protein
MTINVPTLSSKSITRARSQGSSSLTQLEETSKDMAKREKIEKMMEEMIVVEEEDIIADL